MSNQTNEQNEQVIFGEVIIKRKVGTSTGHMERSNPAGEHRLSRMGTYYGQWGIAVVFLTGSKKRG